MKKYYGVFKFTAKSYEHKEHFLWCIHQLFVKKDICYSLEAMNKKQLANSKDDFGLKLFLQSWKDKYKSERRLSLSHTYSTKYVIHECDENGIWVAFKKEINDAKKMYGEC